ncbi:MAG: hypothetical protein R3A49_07030 [Acidimicrobiia bacterium]
MCLVVLVGAFAPRFAIFLVWLFSNRMALAFDSFWIALAGFVFLPFTTLLYAIAYQPIVGVSGFGWFLVGMGFVLDIANWLGGARQRDQRRYD